MPSRVSCTEPRLDVLFIASWYPSVADPVRGVFVLEHARAVAARAHLRVVAMDPPRGRRLIDIRKDGDLGVTRGIETWRARGAEFGRRRPAVALSLIAALVAGMRLCLRRRPDVIHAHVYEAGAVAAVLGLIWRRPVVLTEHYTIYERRRLARLSGALARFALRRATVVAPVSQSLERAIEPYAHVKVSTVIPNAVDTALFSFDPQVPPDDPPLILFVGIMSKVKRLDLLCDALVRLRGRPWRAVLVGDGPTRDEVARTLSTAGLDGRVELAGRQAKPVIAALMRRASMLVLPSDTENLPCVVLEALVSGSPVVATDVGGLAEVVDARNGRLVHPDDPEELAEAMAQVLATPDQYDRSAIAAQASARFSLDAVGTAYLDLYLQVVGR